jgi:hypothetical protein
MAIEAAIGGAASVSLVSTSRVNQLKCARMKIYANLLSSGENQHEKYFWKATLMERNQDQS